MLDKYYDSYGYEMPEHFITMADIKKVQFAPSKTVSVERTEIESFFSESGQGTGDLNQSPLLYPVPHDFSRDYFTFEALEDCTFSFSINDMQYSLDEGKTWSTLEVGTSTPTVKAGKTILWKQTGLIPDTTNGIGTFSSTGQFNAYGNIMSLLYGDDFVGKTDLGENSYTFYLLLFNNRKLIDASNVILPATKLTEHCYAYLFGNCAHLLYAPKLPAKKMERYCYSGMFGGTSILEAPVLPATTLDYACYSRMFWGCDALTECPDLPATNLANLCYHSMFSNCHNITKTPKLPATTLTESCYSGMFSACTALTEVQELPATNLSTQCYYLMFRDCTSLTKVCELPATTLVNNCYQGMFYGCTALTEAPELPAKTLVNVCYNAIFRNCSSLKYIKCLATDISAANCLANWVVGVSDSGTFVKDADATWPTGTAGIPANWTVEDA